MIQHSLTELELRVVTPRPFTAEEELLIRHWCERTLSPEMSLAITYVDQIPRGPTGKYEDFKCELDLTVT